MGMSTHVVGFRPPDERWKRMKTAWDACVEAGVEPPSQVLEFFEDTAPDPTGVEVPLRNSDALRRWSGEYAEGYEVDVTKLPKHVTVVRFYNSW